MQVMYKAVEQWKMKNKMKVNEEKQIARMKAKSQIEIHLRFKHAQPKMCHSPKVENGVDN